VAINGQTGKVAGTSPSNPRLISVAVAGGVAALALLAFLLVRFGPGIASLLRGSGRPGGEGGGGGPSLYVVAAAAGLVAFLIFDLIALLPKLRERLKGRRQE